jgi:hypothetical protein
MISPVVDNEIRSPAESSKFVDNVGGNKLFFNFADETTKNEMTLLKNELRDELASELMDDLKLKLDQLKSAQLNKINSVRVVQADSRHRDTVWSFCMCFFVLVFCAIYFCDQNRVNILQQQVSIQREMIAKLYASQSLRTESNAFGFENV